MDGEAIPEETVKNAKNYIVIYLCILVGTAFALTVDNFDLETNVTAALTCLNNVGPGLGKVIGPTGNFAGFSYFSKILLTDDRPVLSGDVEKALTKKSKRKGLPAREAFSNAMITETRTCVQ